MYIMHKLLISNFANMSFNAIRENKILTKISEFTVQSNLDYSKCQGPQGSLRIIGSSNDPKREFSDIFEKSLILS